jgi:UDP-N-acetylmuramoylalanine--D-glutamate ligase
LNIEAYLNNLKGKKIAVLGVGVSNRPLVRLLRETGIDITAFDRKTEAELGDYASELSALGVELVSQGGLMDDRDYDVIFRSPGIRPDREDILKHISRGAILTSEMEAFFEICPCKIVAVTGSDGKTTTTTMVSELLKAAGYSVHLGGNIGRPLLPDFYMM